MISRELVFRGTVVVSALLIDPRVVGEIEARRRVLAVVRDRATVRRTPHGYLVSTSGRLAVDEALGAPVVAIAGLSTTVPLAPDEVRVLGAPPGSLVVAVAGALIVDDLIGAETIDVSTWLDCSAYVAAVLPKPPPRFAKLASASLVMPTDPLAKVVQKDESPAAREALAALLRVRDRGRATGAGRELVAETSDGAIAKGVASMLGFLASVLGVLGVGILAAASAVSPKSSAADDLDAAPAEPSWLSRTIERLEALASRILLSTRLGALVGEKHAQYFEEMMDAFARKDFDEALRRAIPLGGEGGEDAFESVFGKLEKRSALTITPRLGKSGRGFGVGPVGYTSLRDLYRNAFQALDERGDIDRAAFVLAELLRENLEAVAYLERHDRLKLAAELAEHRKLDPGLVVRLWFRAGEVTRAVRLARRDHAFAAAILASESAEKAGTKDAVEVTRALRAWWMNTLADAGDLEGAAAVALADAELRPLARSFWARGRRAGGALAGRSLAFALLHGEASDPASDEDIGGAATRMIDSPDAGSTEGEGEEREAFVNLLAQFPSRTAPPAARRAARLAVRKGLASPVSLLPRSTIEGLIEVGDDALLRADLPPRMVSGSSAPEQATLDGVAFPGLAFDDVALLESGRRLLAAGEHGVFLVDRAGRTLAHFDAPATELVVSDAGTRALAVAPADGDRHRVTRIDLVGRRTEAWTETKLVAFCSSFDGDTWLVSNGRDLLLLDCLAERPTPLAKIPFAAEAPAAAWLTLWRERGTANVVATQRLLDARGLLGGLRRTQLQSFVLRGVRDFELGKPTRVAVGSRPEWIERRPSTGPELVRHTEAGGCAPGSPFALGEGFEESSLRADPHHTVIAGRRGDDAVLVVLAADALRILLEVRAPRAKFLVASEPRDGRIAVADDRGRTGLFALPIG